MSTPKEPKPTFAEEYAPRENASQLAARRRRAREESDEAPEVAPAARYLPFIVGAVVVAALVLGSLAASQQPQAIRTAPQPTIVPTDAPRGPLAAPSSTPVLLATPIVPSVAPAPSQVPSGAAPQTGKGLTLDSAPAVPVEAPEQPAQAPAANPAYLDNVASQAPHAPRAPVSEWTEAVVQPTAAAEQRAVIERQEPHKVR